MYVLSLMFELEVYPSFFQCIRVSLGCGQEGGLGESVEKTFPLMLSCVQLTINLSLKHIT